jgi:hypothetical protein
MLQIFLKAGGDGSAGEAFRFPIRTMKMKLDAALLAIALKEKGQAHAYMAKEELLYTDICKCIENEYRKLKDATEWTPAMQAQDSKAAPAQFGAYSAQATILTDIQIMALIQNGFATGVKTGSCNHCQKPGHWKNECPDLHLRSPSIGYKFLPF